MLVPARIYASETLLGQMDAGVFEQVTNVACLPGIVRAALCMPDGHWGYGFPIGGVAAFRADTGVISPGGIGFDINCGMRLLRTEPHARTRCGRGSRSSSTRSSGRFPAGVGARGFVRLTASAFRDVMREGAGWCVRHGLRLARGPRAHGRARLLAGGRPRARQRSRPRARPPAARHARLREPLPRDPGGAPRRDPRPEDRPRARAWTDQDRSSSCCTAARAASATRWGPTTSGLRLGHASLRHHRARPRARLRALPFHRGAGLLRRDERPPPTRPSRTAR